MHRQNILIFFIFVLSGVAAFLGSYLFIDFNFQKTGAKGNIVDQIPKKSAVAEATPVANPATNKPLHIGSTQVASPIFSNSSGSILYFEKNVGKIFRVDMRNGKELALTTAGLTDFFGAVWAPTGSAFVYRSRSNPAHFTSYDLATQKQTLLSTTTRTVTFSPDGSQIAYFSADEDSGVYISQPDGSAQKKILSSRLESADLAWPSTQFLSLKTPLSGSSFFDLFILTPTGQLSRILQHKSGLSILWSPNAKKLLYSESTSLDSPSLFVYDSANISMMALPFSANATHCVWSLDNVHVVCGVHSSLLATSSEDIYIINTSTKAAELVYLSGSPTIHVIDSFLSPLEDSIFFVNKNDSFLYKLPLPSLDRI